MSQIELYHQKKDKLKANVGELVGTLLKRLKIMQDSEYPYFSKLVIDDIHIELEKAKEQLEHKEELERLLIGNLGKIERVIDYWIESNEGKNYEVSSTRIVDVLRNEYQILKENLANLGTYVPTEGKLAHQNKTNASLSSTPFEFGESSESNNPGDDGFRELQQLMNELQPHLEKCLHSLSIFPRNKELKKRLLVYWWIGMGIVLQKNENKTDEQLAEEYFSELVEKDVLKPIFRKHNEAIDRCTINPTIHKQLIASCRRDETFSNEKVEEDGTWHFYKYGGANAKDDGDNKDKAKALLNLDIHYLNSSNMRSKMKEIEVVQLGRWQEKMSDGMKGFSKDHIEMNGTDFLGELGQSIRYLSLRGISGITTLPGSIGKIRNLRILDLRYCHDLQWLPQKPRSILRIMITSVFLRDQLKWFDNLTHLDISECHLLDSVPKWICELSNLEVLKGFVVGIWKKKTQISQLRDLSKLKKLRKLSIKIARKNFSLADLSSLEPLDNLLVLIIIWSINNQNDSSGASSNENSVVNEGKKSEVEKQSSDNAKDSLNISEGGCEQISKGDNVVERLEENKQIAIIFPKNLEKLDIRCFPRVESPELLNSTTLMKLKRLYIRGGQLTKIGVDVVWEGEILRLRFLNKFVFNWLKLSSTFPKLKCVEYERCPKLINFPRNRSSWITKQDGNLQGMFNDDEEVISPNSGMFNDDEEANIQSITSVIKSGVGLVLKFLTKGTHFRYLDDRIRNRIFEYPVELELSAIGGEYGLDLVLVLDISRNMMGDNLARMKGYLTYLIEILAPINRLSIVTFSTNANRVLELFPVTRSFQTELKGLIKSLKADYDGDTNTFDGLEMGLKVLKDRRFCDKRDVGVILMSAGPQTIRFGDAAKVPLGNVPVHTFGFGESQDSTVLKAIAANSIGVSYPSTPVDNEHRLDSFYAILGTAVKDLKLTFTPTKELYRHPLFAAKARGDLDIYGRRPKPRTINLEGVLREINDGYTVAIGYIFQGYPKKELVHLCGRIDYELKFSYEFRGEKFKEGPLTLQYVKEKDTFNLLQNFNDPTNIN